MVENNRPKRRKQKTRSCQTKYIHSVCEWELAVRPKTILPSLLLFVNASFNCYEHEKFNYWNSGFFPATSCIFIDLIKRQENEWIYTQKCPAVRAHDKQTFEWKFWIGTLQITLELSIFFPWDFFRVVKKGQSCLVKMKCIQFVTRISWWG